MSALPEFPDYVKEEFFKAGWGQNEIMWKCWYQAWQASRKQALEEAEKVCKQLELAIDGGGNHYYRPADARQCVNAIKELLK